MYPDGGSFEKTVSMCLAKLSARSERSIDRVSDRARARVSGQQCASELYCFQLTMWKGFHGTKKYVSTIYLANFDFGFVFTGTTAGLTNRRDGQTDKRM